MITRYTQRRLLNQACIVLSWLMMAWGLFWLGWILWTLFAGGWKVLDWSLLTQMTPPPGAEGGGLANALVGSILVSGGGIILGTPLGILAGTWLAEYAKAPWSTVTRFINDLLLSAPSIIIGLFIYTLYVSQTKHFSGWAGSCALAVIVIPVVVRTTDDMLRLVPQPLREAAWALGCPQWKIIFSICYRAAYSGILTGVLLALARIVGETAPLLFTALNNQFWSLDMNAPIANLPVTIFQFAMSPYPHWVELAWAGALLITLLVLSLNIVARTFFRSRQL